MTKYFDASEILRNLDEILQVIDHFIVYHPMRFYKFYCLIISKIS